MIDQNATMNKEDSQSERPLERTNWFMSLLTQVKARGELAPFLIIAFLIFIFNIIAVFGLDSILSDDQARYTPMIHHDYGNLNLKRLLINTYLMFPFQYLLTVSPVLARLSLVIIWLIPTSLLSYYLYSKIFKINVPAAIAASVLPAILPAQTLLPSYIDGSYMFPGLFFVFTSLIFGFKYLYSDKKPMLYLSVSMLSFIISLLVTELTVFILPPVLFLVYWKFGKSRKVLFYSILLIIVTAIKTLLIILFPYGNSEPNIQGIQSIGVRLVLFLSYMDPYIIRLRSKEFIELNSMIGLIIVLSFQILCSQKRMHPDTRGTAFNKPGSYLLIYWFSLLWILFSILPFVLFSKYYSARYFYYAGFGFYLLLIISSETVILRIFKFIGTSGKLPLTIFIISLIMLAGFNRQSIQSKFFRQINEASSVFRNELTKRHLPVNSQVAIIGNVNVTSWGYYNFSSGYLQQLLNRKDISGVLPCDQNYFNPFDTIKGRNYSIQMSGLSLKLPLFLFRMENKKLEKLEYALQWQNQEDTGSSWIIYKFNVSNGHPEFFWDGTGWSNYHQVVDSLKRNGIPQKMIMFGNIPLKSDSVRLRLKKVL
jgi:hypothetical protein